MYRNENQANGYEFCISLIEHVSLIYQSMKMKIYVVK